MNTGVLGLIALVPLMLGTHPVQSRTTITAELCGGGTIEIPIEGGKKKPANAPCEMKGCHAGCQRKRFDRTQ